MNKKMIVMDVERKDEAAKNTAKRLQRFHELITKYKEKKEEQEV